MLKNKIIILVLITIGIGFISCQKDVVAPLQSCSASIEHNNDTHSNAAIFQEIIDRQVAKGLPGLVMIVETPEDGKWIGAAGMAKLETNEPMQTCHIFHSASVAKTYHAVAAMSLVEEGKLDLDKTIDNYLPDWVCDDLANINSATVRQLMNHTAGIPDFIEHPKHILDYFNDLMRTFTTAEYLDYICGQKANFVAGEGISYSNTNTVLLALIMDEVAGNHADVITENIINKLGLTQTFYKNEPDYPAPKGTVNTYLDLKGNNQFINSSEVERNFANMNIGHDAVLASADDYFTFIKALLNGELLSQNSLDQMLVNTTYAENLGFGLGLEIAFSPTKNVTRVGHEGGSLGAANLVFHYIEKNTTIVISSNFGNFLTGPAATHFYTTLREVESILFD